MSEEDEDDSEPNMTKAGLSEDVGRRASLPRSNKSASRKYEENSDDEDGDDEAETQDPKPDNSDKGSDIFNGMINFDGAAEATAANLVNGFRNSNHRFLLPSTGKTLKATSPSKKRAKYVDLTDESDVSNFSDALKLE